MIKNFYLYDIIILGDGIWNLKYIYLKIEKIILKKYKDLTLDEINCYDDIIKFIKNKNKKGIIEGGQITHIEDISKLKGTIIVKRTARFKCYYRSAYRDFKNPAWRVGLNKLGLIKRFFHCFKRRFHHVFRQEHIEKFIDRLEEYINFNKNKKNF